MKSFNNKYNGKKDSGMNMKKYDSLVMSEIMDRFHNKYGSMFKKICNGLVIGILIVFAVLFIKGVLNQFYTDGEMMVGIVDFINAKVVFISVVSVVFMRIVGLSWVIEFTVRMSKGVAWFAFAIITVLISAWLVGDKDLLEIVSNESYIGFTQMIMSMYLLVLFIGTLLNMEGDSNNNEVHHSDMGMDDSTMALTRGYDIGDNSYPHYI